MLHNFLSPQLNKYLILIILLVPLTRSEIVFVFEQFRHGARASVFIGRHNKDKFKVSWIGDGELTGPGMRMHYLIGTHSRDRYQNLLSKKINPKEVIVYSTDLNRTILSAQSQLLGMYPPEPGIELNERQIHKARPPIKFIPGMEEEIKHLKNLSIPQKIQGIPINIFEHDKKPYLLTETSECPIMQYVKEENFKKKIVQDFLTQFNKTYYEKLSNYFNNTNPNFLFNYINMLGITDHFISVYVHNRTLKGFQNIGINLEDFFTQCKIFKNISLFEIESPLEIGIMATSPVMSDLIKWMDARIKMDMANDTIFNINAPKMVMYSGHDMTLVPTEQLLFKAFGVKAHYPEFATNQFFELHRSDYVNKNLITVQDYYVEYYHNGILHLNVSYLEFKKKVLRLVWPMDKINNFCKVKFASTLDYCVYFTLAISLIFIALVVFRRSKIKKFSSKMSSNIESGNNKVYREEDEFDDKEKRFIV